MTIKEIISGICQYHYISHIENWFLIEQCPNYIQISFRTVSILKNYSIKAIFRTLFIIYNLMKSENISILFQQFVYKNFCYRSFLYKINSTLLI